MSHTIPSMKTLRFFLDDRSISSGSVLFVQNCSTVALILCSSDLLPLVLGAAHLFSEIHQKVSRA